MLTIVIFVIYCCHIGKYEFFSLELQSHLCTESLRAALISLIRWMIDACLLTPRTWAKAGGRAGRAVTLITEGANLTCSTLTRRNEPLLRWDRRLATYIWMRCYNCLASQMWMIPWETEENNPPTSTWQQKSPLQLADKQGTGTEGCFSQSRRWLDKLLSVLRHRREKQKNVRKEQSPSSRRTCDISSLAEESIEGGSLSFYLLKTQELPRPNK